MALVCKAQRLSTAFIQSNSVVRVILKVLVQLSVVIPHRFALQSENISVFVEKEVVILVAESVESNLLKRSRVVDIYTGHVAIRDLSFLRLLYVMSCNCYFSSWSHLLFDCLLDLVNENLLRIKIIEVVVFEFLGFFVCLYRILHYHYCRMMSDNTVYDSTYRELFDL